MEQPEASSEPGLNSLQLAEKTWRRSGWRQGEGPALAKGRVKIQKDRQEGCKAPGLSDGARRGFGLGWIGAAGLPRRRAAAWEAGEA